MGWGLIEEDVIRGKEHEERGGGIVMYRDRSHDRPGQGRAPRQVPKRVYTTRPPSPPSPLPLPAFLPACLLPRRGIIRVESVERGEKDT